MRLTYKTGRTTILMEAKIKLTLTLERGLPAMIFIAALSGLVATAPMEGAPARSSPTRPARALLPIGSDILFWPQAKRDRVFPHMERVFAGRPVAARARPSALPTGSPLPIARAAVDAFVRDQNVAGLLVLQDGRVRLERYARGLSRNGRWTSFSVAKSVTSMLVGAAIRDGAIRSVDDSVTRYLPELKGSAYDGVTVAQLLTMTSGVRWNEDYTDPRSDVIRLYTSPVAKGVNPTIAYMRQLPRATPPGNAWAYKTGETDLVGVLVSAATGRRLADYLSEKLWRPLGMERDAFWMTDRAGHEAGGCCLSMTLRDYGRLGQFALGGGQRIVPDGWFGRATTPKVTFAQPGYGYGYQWWTLPRGRFAAVGIFGQSILVDPAHCIVIVTLSAWPRATDEALSRRRAAFQQRLIDVATR